MRFLEIISTSYERAAQTIQPCCKKPPQIRLFWENEKKAHANPAAIRFNNNNNEHENAVRAIILAAAMHNEFSALHFRLASYHGDLSAFAISECEM